MKNFLGFMLVSFMVMGAGAALAKGVYLSGTAELTSASDNAFDSGNNYGGAVALGYNVSNALAVEAAYDYFGKEANVVMQAYTGWVVIDPTVFKVSNVPVKAIARIGYTGVQTGGGNFDTGVAYGVGVGFGLSKSLDVIVDYRVRDLDVQSLGNIDLSTAGLGLKYEF